MLKYLDIYLLLTIYNNYLESGCIVGGDEIVLRGTSYHTLDSKGRFILPSRFRRDMGGEGTVLVITNFDDALYAYSYDNWIKKEEDIDSLTVKNRAFRRFRRFFVGGAEECKVDKQLRILVPQPLREYAGLNKDIVLVGGLDHFEIWSKERLAEDNRMLLEEDMENEEVSGGISKLGL